jgi:hypothetical protein
VPFAQRRRGRRIQKEKFSILFKWRRNGNISNENDRLHLF